MGMLGEKEHISLDADWQQAMMGFEMATRDGWEQIARVYPQEWRDAEGYIELAIVWIETRDGSLYGRSLLRGETIDKVVSYYERRGKTDAACCLFPQEA